MSELLGGLPERPSVPHYVEAHARQQPNTVAVIDHGSDRWVTYAELWDVVRRRAVELERLGLEVGDRAAIWLPNGLDWIVNALAIHHLRAVVVPINTRYQAAEVAYILEKSGASIALTTSDFLGRDYVADLRSCRSDAPVLREVIDVRRSAAGDPKESLTDVETSRLDRHLAELDPNDVSDIMFTSGTTGYPKGAMITHRNTVATIRAANDRLQQRPTDRHLIVNPFFHMFGYKHGWTYVLMLGGCVVPDQIFDAPRAAALIERYAITTLAGPPTIFQSILDLPQRSEVDLSSLRFGLTGAADVPPELIVRMKDELGFEHVANGFGLTESTAAGTHTGPTDPIDTVATTTGQPLRGIEMRTVDADGRPTPAGVTGEIQLRGFCVMKGYFKDPAATAEAIDGEGWLRTGDLGVLDDDGYLHVVGRLKDVIITGGFNVYPAEVERVIGELPGVAEAALIGRPDARLGEVPVVYVEGNVTADEVRGWCATRLANFKRPHDIVIVEALPRTAMGKVRKGDLREQDYKRKASDMGDNTDHTDGTVHTVDSENTGNDVDGLRTHLRELIREHLPETFIGAFTGDPADLALTQSFCHVLAAEKLLCLAWPREYGGAAASPWLQTVVREEMWAHCEPRGPQYMGVNWVGPVIMRHGSDALRDEHLPRISAGEVIWCQGFSETEAGSDLASLRTSARTDGDGFRINGQKVWTSYAAIAQWCFLLARTETDPADKRKGITVFLVPMDSPGIVVRRLDTLVGPEHLNEVFFTDVYVPGENVLGPVGEGWPLVLEVLAYERLGIARYAKCDRLLSEAREELGDGWTDLAEDLRDRWARALVRSRQARLMAYRVVAAQSSGTVEPSDVAAYRVAVTMLDQEVSEVVMEICGSIALAPTDRSERLARAAEDHWRYAQAGTVSSGTIEMQRRAVARSVLAGR